MVTMELLTNSQNGSRRDVNYVKNTQPLNLFVLVPIACLFSAAIGAAFGIIAFRLMQRTPQDLIVTHRLMVVDASGETRATISTDDRGEVSMNFTAPQKNPALSIGILRRSDSQMKNPLANGQDQQMWVPYMRMREASGRPAAELTTVGHGNAVFHFYGDQLHSGIEMGYLGDGRDDGTFGAAWGFSASYKAFSNQLGVYAQDTKYPYSMVPQPPNSR